MASFAGTTQKCKACEKAVYLVDQLTADNKIYHKSCFRCYHCKGTLKSSYNEAIVPLPTSEIQYVRDAVNSFIGWPRHLVKPLSYDSDLNVRKPVEHSSDAKLAGESDPLGELMKILFYVYQNPVEVPWEANQFGLPEIGAKFYITHADLAEIISGDKCLNIAILQLWTIFMNECGRSKADQSLYGLLEPQSIQNAKERRQQCQQYIETWVKESQRQLYLGAYLNQAHWQLFVLHPRENTIVWFCSLRKKPDINIKGAINRFYSNIQIMASFSW
eukprot:XP_014627997.1 uncharacterized protein LOC102662735 [Glycine max]